MAEINWTVSIIFQYYEEDKFFFESLKNDIESQTPDNHRRVKYFLLKHDEVEKTASAFTIDDNRRLDKRVAPFGVSNNTEPFDAAAFYADFHLAENMWVKFFQNAAEFETANHFVMTIGHGDGFGFTTEAGLPDSFRDDADFLKLFRNLQRILSMNVVNSALVADQLQQFKNINKRSLRLAETISHNTLPIEKFGMIPVSVFSSSIARAFKQQKLSVLYLGNCFIQTIENGYLLKDQTRFLCASEGMYYSPGTDFPQLFSQMGSPQQNNLEIILEQICSGIDQKLKEQRIIDFFKTKESDLLTIKQTFCFSVNNLETYEILKGLVSDIGQLFIDNRDTTYNLITNIRNDPNKCRDVFDNPLGIIDLNNFCKKLSSEINLPAVVKSKLDNLITFIDTSLPSIIASKRFPEACSDPTAGGDKAIFPTGVSIFFPRMKPGVETNQYLKLFFDNFYTDKKFITSFLAGNKWRDFVIDYYSAQRLSVIQRFMTFINKLFKVTYP